jgi:DNA-binding beta-propeller fold protein YncE
MPKSRYLLSFVLTLLSLPLAAQLRQIAMVDIPGRPGFDAMALAGNYLVIAHRGANAVDIFDVRLRRLKTQITGMSDPRGIAVDQAAGRVYIANAGDNSLAVLSTADWKLIDTIPLQHSPDALLLASGRLYIANGLENSVAIVDPAQHRELDTLTLAGRPQDLLFDPATGLIFASLEEPAQIVAFDAGQQIAKRFPLAGSQPTGMALAAKDRRLFVAVRSAVLVLDADSGAELGRVPAAPGITTLWFDESNRALYTAATNGSVNLIAVSGDQFLSQHELQTQVRGHSLAYDSARGTIYLTGGREGRSKLVILKPMETQVAVAPASLARPPKAEVTAEKK